MASANGITKPIDDRLLMVHSRVLHFSQLMLYDTKFLQIPRVPRVTRFLLLPAQKLANMLMRLLGLAIELLIFSVVM